MAIGNAVNGALGNRLVAVEVLFNIAGIDVEPRGDDHIVDAVHQIGKAVFVHVANIAGVKAAALQRVRGRIGVVTVALEDLWAFDADLSALACG